MNLKPYLDYWRQCLADSQRQAPRLEPQFVLDQESLEGGKLSKEKTSEIFDEAERLRRTRKGRASGSARPEGSHPTPPDDVALLIAPLRLRIRVEHGERLRRRSVGSELHLPLWIPARLQRSRVLKGDPEGSAWIGREFLAPTGTGLLILGELAASDGFRSLRSGPGDRDDWAAQLTYAVGLFEAVTGSENPWDFALPETVNLGPIAVLADRQIRAAGHLLQAYDQLRRQPESLSTALGSLVRGGGEPRFAELDALLADFGNRPLGHVSSEFGLQPSQRKALLAGLSLEHGEILAIQGPPGTGKTTLLQSLVASLWVEKALAGGEPPVIHACSSNNRAIENVLETFGRAIDSNDDGAFARRWLPGPDGYGLSMPSRAQAQKHEGRFPIARRGVPCWSGLPEISHDREATGRGQNFFLRSAREAFGQDEESGLDVVIDRLHSELTAVHQVGVEILGLASQSRSRRAAVGVVDPGEYLADLRERRQEVLDELESLRSLASELDAAIASIPFWEDLLAFLPPIRLRRTDRVLAPFRQRSWRSLPDLGGSDFRAAARSAVAVAEAQKQDELAELDAALSAEQRFVERVAAVAARLPSPEEIAEKALRTEEALQELLDRTVRRYLFQLAGRYWEGRWLREVRDLREIDDDFARRKGLEACRRRFRRFAMLTPISVSTFYMLPSLFDYFDGSSGEARPLAGGIDLLLVDEAGQTTPDSGALALHYADRAIIVGDCAQLEPIWTVDETLDLANQRKSGLDLSQPRDDAFRSSRGSLMAMAQRSSAVRDRESHGILLTEHWRCRHDIIEYCNRLIYRRLEAKRPNPQDPYLPTFGWAHLGHRAERRGGSWVNPGNARAIVDWIARRRPELEEHYGSLEHVGVVTPFRAQAWEIKSCLRDQGLGAVEVGTVHTFQGGERAVMIFSSVYDSEWGGNYFFDSGPNLLNVAVSRARESLLVFGDMGVFRPPPLGQSSAVPSRLLAEFLFADPTQEITDVEGVIVPGGSSRRVVRIDRLTEHRRCLRRAFEEATQRLLVVSPYLTPRAIAADEVAELVRRARDRGVRVVVAYCRDLVQRRATEAKTTEARTCLEEAGAEVLALDRIHNKSLAVDDRWIVEGSFNWLSATRDPTSRYQRAEASLLCRAPLAVEMIEAVWTLVNKRRGALEAESP